MNAIVRKIAIQSDIEDGHDGVFSDPKAVDAYDDLVGDGTPGSWLLDNYQNNPIVLAGHEQSFVAGTASRVRVDLMGSCGARYISRSPRRALAMRNCTRQRKNFARNFGGVFSA